MLLQEIPRTKKSVTGPKCKHKLYDIRKKNKYFKFLAENDIIFELSVSMQGIQCRQESNASHEEEGKLASIPISALELKAKK